MRAIILLSALAAAGCDRLFPYAPRPLDSAAAADSTEDADIVIVNTCAVRQKSEEKLYSYLGRLARMKRKRAFVLGVAGCVAQIRKADLLTQRPSIDLVVGPDGYLDLPELIIRAAESPEVRAELGPTWREIGADAIARANAWSAFVRHGRMR